VTVPPTADVVPATVLAAAIAAAAMGLAAPSFGRPPPPRLRDLRSPRAARGRTSRSQMFRLRPPSLHRRVRALAIVVGAAVATVVAPLAVPVVIGVLLILPAARARRATQRRHRAEVIELPEVAELLATAVEAGLTTGDAIAVVGEQLSGGLGRQLEAARRAVMVGHRLTDAMQAAADRAGPAGQSLFGILGDGVASGAPVAPALRRLAADGRETRRRHAEAAARRLPVKLLFPLVGCVLPAFALLTVVPVVAGALRSLRH
jgi:tight adherence protein C